MPRNIKRLYIVLTERCNMKCPHCYIKAGNINREEELCISQYIDVIKELTKKGLKYVKITGGEPLLRKNVVKELLHFCNKKEIFVSLETNGTLVDQADIEEFGQLNDLEIGMSLDYPKADQFDTFRGYMGAYEKICTIAKEFSQRRIPTTLITTIFNDNINLMDEIADLVINQLKVNIKFGIVSELGRAKEKLQHQLLHPKNIFIFHDKLQKIADKYPNRVTAIIPYIFYQKESQLMLGSCKPEEIIGLMPNGDVSLCGIGNINDTAIWGNIKRESILDIVDDSAKKIENLLAKKFEGVCSKCLFKQYCANICPAASLEVYGSFTASYPICQKLYDNGLFPKEFIVET